MALRFRLSGLAETFVENGQCPHCGILGDNEQHFSAEHTRVTCQGIIVVFSCRGCGEIFVPGTQRRGVINPKALINALVDDCRETGEPLYNNIHEVALHVEVLNAERRGQLQ